MSHSITCKLNSDARQHPSEKGVTFFVSLGEKNYNHKTGENEYTNYDAALFAKDAQIGFYSSALVKGSVIEVACSGLLVDDSNKEYKPKLVMVKAELGFVHSEEKSQNGQGAPQSAPQAAPQAPQAAPQSAPSQLGYYFPDGTPMQPSEVEWYTSKNIGPWAKGTNPPTA